jgi:hypothetical protein
MPMIRGRYYMNPAMGAAIESARALGDATQVGDGPQDSFTAGDDGDSAGQGTGAAPAGSIHRVEIEIAQAPAGGRSSRGYVARVHRETIEGAPAGAHDIRGALGVPSATPGIPASSAAQSAPGFVPRGVFASAPESHVFAHAGDLVNFLREALAED